MIRRALALGLLAMLVSASVVFAVDISAGLDAPVGLSWRKITSSGGDSTNGLLYGAGVAAGFMFTPQLGADAKVSFGVNDYSLGGEQFMDRTLNVTGLFKYYVKPAIFVGGGLQYNRFVSSKSDFWDATTGDAVVKRDDLSDTDDVDPLFLLVAAGYDYALSSKLVVPFAANVGYGLLNIPDDTMLINVYATIGMHLL